MEQTQQKSTQQTADIFKALAAPFTAPGADGEVYYTHKWKLLTNKGTCVPYVDSRQVSERLNQVLGIDGWSDTLIETTGNYIIDELSIYVNGQVFTRSDVGTPGNIEGAKGQASDALKRAAVKFGVGAYLYETEPVTVNVIPGPGGKKVPATKDGKPMDGDQLTSYINQKHPLRSKLTEVYASLSDEQKSNLQKNFKEIWNALSNS